MTEAQISGVHFVEYYIMPKYKKNAYALEALMRIIKSIRNSEIIVAFDTVRECVYNVHVVNLFAYIHWSMKITYLLLRF